CDPAESLAPVLADPLHLIKHPSQLVLVADGVPREIGDEKHRNRMPVGFHVPGLRVDPATAPAAQIDVPLPIRRKASVPAVDVLTGCLVLSEGHRPIPGTGIVLR